ncbi:MAG: phosphoserine phosphatase [Myxococcaceae bacterium]
MTVAFFDLDRTLLAVNSGTLWVRREVALGFLRKRDALRAALWLARYQLGFASAEKLVEDAVAQLAGSPAEPLRERTRRFFEAEVRPTYRPGGRQALEHHRQRGDRVVMLTSSTNYLAELVADELGLDEILCNTLEVGPDGRHTGRVVGRVCFGAGKLPYAQDAAQKHGVALEACTFYTDSFSDLPVLERVGRPVAVNPDPRLRRQAGRRGWTVTDWGEPQADGARGEVA